MDIAGSKFTGHLKEPKQEKVQKYHHMQTGQISLLCRFIMGILAQQSISENQRNPTKQLV